MADRGVSVPSTSQDVSFDDLTPRQQETLILLARGLSRFEIADQLGTSHYTVRNHIADIYNLLNCNNRIQALIWVLSQPELADQVMEPLFADS